MMLCGVEAVDAEPGTYDVGLPESITKLCAPSPKATGLGTEFAVRVGNVAVEPDGTAVTSVSVVVDLRVVCSEPGQLIRPEDSQLTPV